MKKIIFLILISYILQLSAGLADYEQEFGFPLDKPRYSKYYYLRELLSIAHDPQIMTYKADESLNLRQNLIDELTVTTELDKIELSDSTLVLDVGALNDLDLFSSLNLNNKLSEYEKINISASDYQLTSTEPADYNLYTRMEIPELLPQKTSTVELLPVTDQSRQALQEIIPIINQLSYQIDNIFLRENNILPQSGSLDFIITIGPQGVENVDYRFAANSRFSQGFLNKALDAIKRWQIKSPARTQYTLTRQYLSRP
ncbi:MAG: hypothetical protein K9N06_00040 [Candidatus Cloacimonetes bacterium]|nr:hypothetical protein [Candidatus Cloacimonadota bacterium]